MSHPYSLSAAPTKNHLRITVKDLGDHSRSLAFLKPGTRVFVEGPYGALLLGVLLHPHVVLVGGGVGITPVRALMDEFNGGAQIDVIFRASREEDLVLKAEMDYLGRAQWWVDADSLFGGLTQEPSDGCAFIEGVSSDLCR
jgi:predicted ferric reductase